MGRDMKRKIAAILAADVAGYSRLISEDEEDTLNRLASYRDVFQDFVVKAGGRVFNTAGDAVLAEFPSSVEATRCAIDIQESLRTRNLGYQPSRQMLFRIGITIGDVVEREGDLLGDGVNIAARLEGLAAPGGICVSRAIYEQVANKLSVPFRDVGLQEVKNIPQPVHAFMVDMWAADAPFSPPEKPAQRPNLPLILGGIGVALGLAAVGVTMLRSPAPQPPTENAPLAAPQQASSPKLPEGLSPAEAFARLAKAGGIVQNPTSIPELYHNARSFEARGEAVSARRDYLALANKGGDALDPHLRFAALLRAQDGRAGAREIYTQLIESTRGRAARLVHALQFDGEERRRRVEEFANANPDYPPAQVLLADEYGADRIGTQTLADRRKEFEALNQFLKADTEGRLVPFYLDHSVLAEVLDRARKRHSALETHLKTATGEPQVQFMRSGTSWTVSLSLPEAASSISYRLAGEDTFRSTGMTSYLDQRTGKPSPNSSFELPASTPAGVIDVKYEDATGRTAGPFAVAFDPDLQLRKGQKDTLERFSTNWIAFGQANERTMFVYYSQLASTRCAITKMELGLDDQPLMEFVTLPPCDAKNPFSIPEKMLPYLQLPAATKKVRAKLTYFDGSQSEEKIFTR